MFHFVTEFRAESISSARATSFPSSENILYQIGTDIGNDYDVSLKQCNDNDNDNHDVQDQPAFRALKRSVNVLDNFVVVVVVVYILGIYDNNNNNKDIS